VKVKGMCVLLKSPWGKNHDINRESFTTELGWWRKK